jgi:hypothetical protein
MSRGGEKQPISPFKNILKKVKKKACQPFEYSINGNLGGQMGPPSRSKIF